MSDELLLGKTRGLVRMATDTGHFTMLALDQRPPIAQIVAAARNVAPAEVAYADMVGVKRVIADALASHASAVLLDPNYGFPAALAAIPARTGLVVTLEDHRFADTPGGRLSHSIADWSVDKIKGCGADGVKVLAWYRPDADPAVAARQRAYVEAIGQECRHHDIAYVLELLVYPFAASARHTADYVESPEKLPELVIESVREFAQPRYGVDLFKLESPLPGATLPEHDSSPAAREVQQHFDAIGAICAAASRPWVMLSAGVTAVQFRRVLEYAYAAGASGFLAGRAIWLEAMRHFPDLARASAALAAEGPGVLDDLAELTRAQAHAWRADYRKLERFSAEGELCAAYAQ